MKFAPAVRRKAKARIAISGPSGSGKTTSALLMAAGLGGRIAVIDAEKGSASLYAGVDGIPAFDVLELSAPYSPERYIEAMGAAAEAGYDITIIDGITPEWSGVGGCMELVDQIAVAKYRGNGWSAWNEVTPRHRRFIDAMLSHPGHLIATMRSKTETAQEEKNGRKTVVKLGMKAEQREGIEYEFTAVLDLAHGGHYATASKDRTRLWVDQDPHAITNKDGQRLLAWLEAGEAPPPPPPGMDKALRDSALAAIRAAETPEDLMAHCHAGQQAAREAEDREAYDEITAAKDARKAVLSHMETQP